MTKIKEISDERALKLQSISRTLNRLADEKLPAALLQEFENTIAPLNMARLDTLESLLWNAINHVNAAPPLEGVKWR